MSDFQVRQGADQLVEHSLSKRFQSAKKQQRVKNVTKSTQNCLKHSSCYMFLQKILCDLFKFRREWTI